jgi:hypothetical protein
VGIKWFKETNDMSIIKSKSRKIEVNGESYRWLVSKCRKWWSGDLSIAIEKSEDGRKTLVVDPGFARPNKFTTADLWTGIVKPANVREYIIYARENGWDPEEKGSALLLIWEKKILTNDIGQNNWISKY